MYDNWSFVLYCRNVFPILMWKTFVAKQRSLCYMWKSSSLYTLPVLPSFFILKTLNIHIYWSKHFLFKISKLCGIFIIWDLDIWTALFLCASFCRRAFSCWMGTAESWVQHCWVFYQMDTRYESGLSFSQGPNVCVGLHIAYLETTQVP